LPPHFVGQVLVLGVTEAPYLIALDPLGADVPQYVVAVLCDGFAQFVGELLDGVLDNPRHSGGGPDRTAVNQASDDGTAFFVG
jgi:hypothetical protein